MKRQVWQGVCLIAVALAACGPVRPRIETATPSVTPDLASITLTQEATDCFGLFNRIFARVLAQDGSLSQQEQAESLSKFKEDTDEERTDKILYLEGLGVVSPEEIPDFCLSTEIEP